MTIDKAIEILTDYKMQSAFEATTDFTDALKLGIEALKRLKEHREEHIDITFRALSGETKD